MVNTGKLSLHESVQVSKTAIFFKELRELSVNFETITILSKGLIIIGNNLLSHQALHIWDHGLNFLTATSNGYNP